MLFFRLEFALLLELTDFFDLRFSGQKMLQLLPDLWRDQRIVHVVEGNLQIDRPQLVLLEDPFQMHRGMLEGSLRLVVSSDAQRRRFVKG